MLLPLLLSIRSIKHIIKNTFPQASTTFLKIPFAILYWIVLEIIGLHLVLDPIIPGQGTIYVHAAKTGATYPFAMKNIRIEIAPVEFEGHIDLDRIQYGSFSETGAYSALVKFNWGEHRIYVRAYDQAQPDRSLLADFISISPYVRVGLCDKHVYLESQPLH
jgi:hypothetical protein